MATKPKSKTRAVLRVPQTREETASAIARMGELQRELCRVEADLGDEVAAVKARFEALAEPLRDEAEALHTGVQTWCEAHRDTLTQGGKVKTAAFSTGEVAWRTAPPSVVVRGSEAVLEALERAGLKRFIRFKSEINKEAIREEPEAVRGIPGITIKQEESFAIAPFEAELVSA